MDQELIVSILQGTIRISVLILLPALGEIFAERSGVLNLSLEGAMLWGALAGFVTAFATGSYVLAVLASAMAGLLLSLIFALMCVRWKANQVITALVLNLLAQGVATLSYRAVYGTGITNAPRIVSPQVLPIPLLSKIPFIGPVVFTQPLATYLVWLAVPLFALVLYRTHLGLTIRACGDQPYAAASVGANVLAVRFLCVLFGGMLAGLAGLLTVMSTGIYDNAMIGGRGFMAVSVVIFGRWNPFIASAGALLFGVADSMQLHLQVIGLKVPYQFIQMLPYVLTVLVLWGAMIRPGSLTGRPTYLTKHYDLESS